MDHQQTMFETFDQQRLTPQGRQEAKSGHERKREGMQQAATNKKRLLSIAREVAKKIARGRESRCVSMDDVQEGLTKLNISDRALGNAAGSLFKESCWEFTGRFIESTRPHAHRNLIRVWRLRE